MKILYVLQQSIYNKEGKWLTGDSNINMMLGMLRSMRNNTDFWNDAEIDVMIAPLKDFADLESYDKLFKDDRVTWIPFDFPVNAFINRQHFDAPGWSQVIQAKPYDVIINNITELSRNIKTLLWNYKSKAKLVTQCFWLDAPMIDEPKVDDTISYDWRQFDGFECSDLVTFTCESTKAAFVANTVGKFHQSFVTKILDKSNIWDFGYSEDEAEEYYKVPTKTVGKKRIAFLNRLSEINYTHHMEFIEALKIVAQNRDDFEVVFTNPSQKISFDWLEENVPNFVPFNNNKALDRQSYWDLLNSSDISVHLFTIERYGGCALRESMAAGNVTIAANCFEQASIINNPDLLVDRKGSSVDVHDLATKINAVLDYDIETMAKVVAPIMSENYKRCSFEETTKIVIADLDKMSQKKLTTA